MAEQDLTTIENVRAFLQKAETDTSQDPIIEALITRASNAIMRYTEREFAPVAESTVRTFVMGCHGVVDLAPYDLQSIDEITVDAETDQAAILTDSEYRALPLTDGTFTRLQLNPISGPPDTRFMERTVQIEGTWGFPSIPSDVEHACILAVVEWTRSQVSAFTTAYEAESQADPTMSLPLAARAIIQPYKRSAYV